MRRVLLAVVSTVTGLVMLLSFNTHPATMAAAAASAPPAAVSSATPTPSTTASTSSGSTSSAKPATGDPAAPRWGPVQVQVTVSDGKVTAAQAVVYPQNNPRDQEINAYAVPTLNQEAVNAGSASIDMVSG